MTTEDGYILTIFRCNSKRNITQKRKPLIAQHGIVGSSDDFTTNIPSQAIGRIRFRFISFARMFCIIFYIYYLLR